MNLLTVNLCAATAPAKLEALRALLEEKDVAVALLQEVAVPQLAVPGYKAMTNIGEARRGTAILAREDLDLTPLLALPSGRGCAAKVGNTPVVCVYAPAGSRQRVERARFFAEDAATLLAAAGPRAVFGGDFNCVLQRVDTTGTTMLCPELSALVKGAGLEDVWPRASPQPGHTFATARMSARLDRLYAPPELAVHAAEVVAAAFSDHCAVLVSVDAVVQPRPERPPSAWRFDRRILKDPDYISSFKTEWARCAAARDNGEDVVQWWLRRAKPAIRRHAAHFTRNFRRECRNKIDFLYELLQGLVVASPRTAEDAALIKETKTEILAMHSMLLEGVKCRAALDSMTQDEPLSLVHLTKASRRTRQARIEVLEDADGNVACTAEQVQSLLFTTYKAKFSPAEGGEDRWDTSAVLAEVDATVTEEDNARLTTPFTKDEVLAALRASPRGKSPGEDGLPAELYLATWCVLGDTLTELMNTMLSSRMVPANMLEGIITLIPKCARPRRIKDLRPITLLDVDAKLLARLLVRRLGALDSKLLHPNQVRAGGVRSMAGALADLRDVLSACGVLREPCAVLSTDFSGAFDAVLQEGVFEVLRRRGVSAHFIDVLKAMYRGAASRLLVNNTLTESFRILRSVRQGCPLSMLLFSVVLAPLLQHLEKRLTGMSLAKSCLKVSSYADDAYYVLRSEAEAAVVRGALDDFAEVSGLVVNVQKCAVLAAGTWDPALEVGFPYVQSMKVLGVVFRANIKEAIKDNWTAVVAGVRGLLRDNAPRGLGLSQRAEYVKIFALSRLWHVAQILPANKSIAADVMKAVSMFLWRGRLFTTAAGVACTPRAQGGLGLPDVAKKCCALYAGRWQGIMVHDQDSFAGEWLTVLLRTFPLTEAKPKVWPAAHYFRAFHEARRTASKAPADVPASVAIRAMYDALVAASSAPKPRVQAKAPDADWTRVWANVGEVTLPTDVRDSWWTAVHDLVATRDRLHRIGRSETRTCPTCRLPDTLRHRVTACGDVRTAWGWARKTLSRMLGVTATVRTLLQPDFDHPNHERRAAAAWIAAHTVHLSSTATKGGPAAFAAAIMKAKARAMRQSHLSAGFRTELDRAVR